jgi:dihydroorotate dehydrogenase
VFVVSGLVVLYGSGMDGLVLDNSSNDDESSIVLSNAAGFNKNGEISPETLGYLGFERVVVGTVTRDEWRGNEKPRVARYPETESLVNWMGLPGEGAKAVADRLASYTPCNIPLTVNLMSTPGKQGDELLRDLEGTVNELKWVDSVDRFELNISCPNTHGSGGGMDARSEYERQLGDMLGVVEGCVLPYQELYVKLSPELDSAGIQDTFSALEGRNVAGLVATNTILFHDPLFIPNSPGKGGASGNAVCDASRKVQGMLMREIAERGLDMSVIACGGINSVDRVKERIAGGASEIQMYTPLVFKGPGFLRELRDVFAR